MSRSPSFKTRIAVLAGACLALGLAAVSDSGAVSAPPPFNPSAGAAVADATAGTPSDLTVTFSIGAPDANFATLILFVPADWGVAVDANVPDGARVGALTAEPTLGLLNNGCGLTVAPEFMILEATTVMSPMVTFDQQFGDADGDGIPNGAESYPDFLSRLLVDRDPRDPGAVPLQPRARLYGQVNLAGTNVSANLTVFDPGTAVQGLSIDPALGYPIVVVLQDTDDPGHVAAPGSIDDLCTPISAGLTSYAVAQDNPNTVPDEGGATYRTNPGTAANYYMTSYATSQLDADGDGIENGFDSCPFVPRPADYDPRAVNPNSDLDLDGLPDNCDPTPDENTGGASDHDSDGYRNRGDNCPVDYNAPGTPDNQTDSDGDDIGDACDVLGAGGIGLGPTTPDGSAAVVCLTPSVAIGGGGANVPPDPNALSPCPAPPPASCLGVPATLTGTAGNDLLIGTSLVDVVAGLGGNDTIFGLAGNDIICAGPGGDTVLAGAGNDLVLGEDGNDRLLGGNGDDRLRGGAGTDLCAGGPGTDTAAACEITASIP